MSPEDPDPVLKAGTAWVDITPSLEVGLLMSSVEERWAPFESVRRPLKTRVLVLESDGEKAALVSLDLLGLSDTAVGGWQQFKAALARGISPDRIIITCTHTHTAPESVAITDLYRTESFHAWINGLKEKIADTITTAGDHSSAVRIGLLSTRLDGWSLQRRIPTPSGIAMSDSMQPISPELLEREPVDRRVRGILFRRLDGSVAATIVHAVCHPVHEMCIPRVSPDFPGELCDTLEESGRFGMPLFVNGAAGDINPTTVCGGSECASRHGKALAACVEEAGSHTGAIQSPRLCVAHREVDLPTRALNGSRTAGPCSARINALSLGPLAMVFLPGEPFVDTGSAIERDSPFEETIVVGFSESSVGYVPPLRVFDEGGYEIGPGKWSFLASDAEEIMRRAARGILNELWDRQSGCF
jgi:neutral ceramidase